jgi:hypothetical protein
LRWSSLVGHLKTLLGFANLTIPLQVRAFEVDFHGGLLSPDHKNDALTELVRSIWFEVHPIDFDQVLDVDFFRGFRGVPVDGSQFHAAVILDVGHNSPCERDGTGVLSGGLEERGAVGNFVAHIDCVHVIDEFVECFHDFIYPWSYCFNYPGLIFQESSRGFFRFWFGISLSCNTF